MLTQNDTIGRDYVLVDPIDLRNKGQTSTMEFADFKEARAVLRRNFLCKALRRHNGVIAQVVEVIGILGKKTVIKSETWDADYDYYYYRKRY